MTNPPESVVDPKQDDFSVVTLDLADFALAQKLASKNRVDVYAYLQKLLHEELVNDQQASQQTEPS
jgi:hypothetical protein